MAASMKHLLCLRSITASHQLLNNTTKLQVIQERTIAKHYDPTYKRQRREKVLKCPLPDYERMYKFMRGEITPAEIRAFMRQRGAVPFVHASPVINLANSNGVIDPYVPKEGDSSLYSSITEVGSTLKKKTSKFRGLRELKKYEQDFKVDEFPDVAQDIYERTHELLTKVFPRTFLQEKRGDEDELYNLHDLVTELCWPDITNGLYDKTLVWRFIESLEAPRVVHVVCQEAMRPENRYAQITVRFHTKQIMAIYDRFGRLIHGSTTIPKDVLDYIVFEKHITDDKGRWRMHSKVQPDWAKDNNMSDDIGMPPRTVLLPKAAEDTAV